MDKKYLRKKYGYPPDCKIIITTSRLTPKNGVDILLKAIARIETNNKILVLILGDGPQKPILEQMIRKLRLGNKVILLGYIPHHQLPEYLNLADIFCRPSLDEGFGISFIEAMACKLPVIGTNICGIVDIIEDGKNGLLATPGSVSSLVEKLDLLLTDDTLREKLAEEGYKTVQKRFTWDTILKKMEKTYENLIVA